MNCQAMFLYELIKNTIHPDKDSQFNEEIDWSFLVSLAKEHNLLPIFVEGASKYASYIARPDYMKELQETMSVVAAQVKRTEAFLKLYEAFVREDIHPLIMKGLICRELYGNLCDHRPSSDEDILIRPEEYWKAKEVLLSNGYVPHLESDTEDKLEELQEVSFTHPIERLHIELHLNPIGKENDTHIRMNDCFKYVFDGYREVDIHGVKVRTMSHYNHLLFLILHAFKHFVGSGLGIRQLLDILLYQEQYGDEIDLTKMCGTLQELKAAGFWSDIIHIGNSYFGFDLQAPLKPKCPQDLLENMIESGTFGSRNEAEKIAANTMGNVRKEGSKKQSNNPVALVWKAIFPSKEYMLVHAPYLAEKPWLLPVEWVKRWGRFMKRSKKQESNLAFESVRASQRRMKMLKKYDLI